MEKVICDVCGTDYPETAAQCPICGCARGGGGQTSAGNTTATGEERPAYTYTKGGRFSKSNVRKRLKAAQKQSAPVIRSTPEPEYDDYEDEAVEEEEEPSSNGGLIAIVILLLLAIIAVSSYIAVVHFDLLGGDDPTNPVTTTGSVQTTESDPTPGDVINVPCKDLTVTDSEITLKALDSVWTLAYVVDPIDTTDQIKFQSSDENVATVDSKGCVTAVGSGEAVITITCGEFTRECVVKCAFSDTEDPTVPSDPVDPTVPADPTDPSEPAVPEVTLKLNRTDFTLSRKGESWKVYSGELDPAEITWTSKNENVVTVENGKVVAVGVGRTQIVAEYEGQKVTCWVSCTWEEEKPTEPTDPADPTDPAAPSDPTDEPAAVYKLKINDLDPYFSTGDNSCEVSIKVGEAIRLTVVNELEARMDVTWTVSNEGYVTIDGNKITGAAPTSDVRKITVTGTYDGQTFTCVIRISE